MRVSDSARVVFVHVQKTGGSTVDHVFDREVPDARRVFRGERRLERHSPYRRILKAEPAVADYWSFGFVRNPWARMVSWFSMYEDMFTRYRAGEPKITKKFEAHPDVWLPFEPYSRTFEDFVLGAPTIPKVGRTQVDMLTRPDGSLVDFVGRTESFSTDLAVVRERLGLPQPEAEPQRNRSSHGHYSTYYTPELRDHVAKVYAADVETFGYEFETP
jgi:hypothetical protein